MNNDIEAKLAKELGVKKKMIRFFALRMLVELDQGKPLNTEDQRRLYNQSSVVTVKKVFGIE